MSGTGFEAGAVLTTTFTGASGASEVSSSFVNSTTMTLTLNVAAGSTTGQVNITVHNPDATTDDLLMHIAGHFNRVRAAGD